MCAGILDLKGKGILRGPRRGNLGLVCEVISEVETLHGQTAVTEGGGEGAGLQRSYMRREGGGYCDGRKREEEDLLYAPKSVPMHFVEYHAAVLVNWGRGGTNLKARSCEWK